MGGNSGTPQEQWHAAFNNTLSYRNNRLVTVYNWENIPPEALAAAAQALAEPPPCLVDAPRGLAAARRNATHVRLSWTPGALADAQLLAAGSAPRTDYSGALATADVAAATLDGAAQGLDVAAAQGAGFFWTVVSRGCGPQAQLAAAAAAAARV